jgi:hypothetical protein
MFASAQIRAGASKQVDAHATATSYAEADGELQRFLDVAVH